MSEPRCRRYRPPGPLDLVRTLAPLVRGRADPAHRWSSDGTFWRACRTPDGPAMLALHRAPGGDIEASAWGPGVDFALDGVPALLGAGDDWSQLDCSGAALVHRVQRANPGLRLTRTGLVFDALLPAVLEQRVTGGEARRAWREILQRHGEPAPGPVTGMYVPPSPAAVRQITTWEWHRFGVDAQRVRAVRAAAAVAARLEEAAAMATPDAVHRLRLVPGIGAWTAAETVQRALGCPDTVSVGDFHIPNTVVHVLTGAARGTDDQMLAALAPWAGQRQRVVRLIELSGIGAPRFGPRYRPPDMRAI